MARPELKEVEVWIARDGTEFEDQYHATLHELRQSGIFNNQMTEFDICEAVIYNYKQIKKIMEVVD